PEPMIRLLPASSLTWWLCVLIPLICPAVPTVRSFASRKDNTPWTSAASAATSLWSPPQLEQAASLQGQGRGDQPRVVSLSDSAGDVELTRRAGRRDDAEQAHTGGRDVERRTVTGDVHVVQARHAGAVLLLDETGFRRADEGDVARVHDFHAGDGFDIADLAFEGHLLPPDLQDGGGGIVIHLPEADGPAGDGREDLDLSRRSQGNGTDQGHVPAARDNVRVEDRAAGGLQNQLGVLRAGIHLAVDGDGAAGADRRVRVILHAQDVDGVVLRDVTK